MEKTFTRILFSGWTMVKRAGLAFALLAAGANFAGAQAPVNDECVDAINISDGALLPGQATLTATTSPPFQNCDGDPAHGDLWYKVTSGNSTNDINVTIDAGFGIAFVFSQYFEGSCGTLSSLGCSFGSNLTITPTPNTTYYIRIYEFNGGSMTFDIQASGNIVLPVTMGKLSAALARDNSALLYWATYKEENNRGFDIERSSDGKNFGKIGFVPAQAPGGNSSRELPYRFEDKSPIEGTVYYRLQQKDMDGVAAFSNIVQVNGNRMNNVELYPNPVTTRFTLKLPEQGDVVQTGALITITDLSGKVLWRRTASANRYDIDMTSFPAGTYFLRYTDRGHTTVRKVIKN